MISKKVLDGIVCVTGARYNLPPLLVKSICYCESSFNERAFRHEPAFWTNYLRNNPEWKDKDPAIVSSSYGLMQLMWTTAWALGFRGTQEDLWKPDTNVDLGCKLLRQLIDKVIETVPSKQYPWLSPLDIALARYNGGKTKNPNVEPVLPLDRYGNIRNKKYVVRVLKTWDEFSAKGDNPCAQA